MTAIITIITLTLVILALTAVAVILQRRLTALADKHEVVSAYARDVAEDMHYDHYRHEVHDWQVAHDPMEILSQISNMSTGLLRRQSNTGGPCCDDRR